MRTSTVFLLSAALALSALVVSGAEETATRLSDVLQGEPQDSERFFKLNKTGSIFNSTGLIGRKILPRRWECLLDKNCPTERPICFLKTLNKTKAKTCVQCLTDDDCPEFQRPCDTETNRCKALVVPLVSLVIRFDGITVETFTDTDRTAVCANLLTLAGLTPETGTCTILSILPGSVIVLAEVRANGGSPEDFAIINNLAATLTAQTVATLDQLASGVSGNPTATVDSVEEGTSSIDTSQPSPVPPTAPTNVQASFPANGQCIDNALVTWTAPSSDGGATIATYVVACSSGTTSAAVTVSGSVTSAQVGPLAANTTYRCGLTAVNAAGASPQSEPSPAFSTPGVPGQPSQPTTSGIAGEPTQRSIIWDAASTTGTCPITASSVVCTSSDGGSTVVAPAVGAITSATVTGLSLGSNYTCNVTSSNGAGFGTPSLDSTSFIVGCACETEGVAYTLLPQPVPGASIPEGCWYKNDMRSTATADIVSLESESVTYPALLPAPTGTTSALKLVTPLSDNPAKASVALNYGSLGWLLGTTFKTLVDDPNFAVKYDWFKAGPCTGPACNVAAAPAIRLILYSAGAAIDGTAIRGNFNTLVWEPYWNSPYNGGVGGYLDQWNIETITALTGTNNPVTGANGANQGWWETSSGWGDAAYRVNGGGTQRNLAQWSAYYSSLSTTLDDAIIVEVQVGIGTFNSGLTTFTNNVELVASTSLSDECVFEAP